MQYWKQKAIKCSYFVKKKDIVASGREGEIGAVVKKFLRGRSIVMMITMD
jgi:hypothetical protein